MSPGAFLDALTSTRGHSRQCCLSDSSRHCDRLSTLTSAIKHPYRFVFASPDLSLQSRPSQHVDICDEASVLRRASRYVRRCVRAMVFAVTFFAVFHMLPQVPAHDVEQRMRTRVAATRWDELACGTPKRVSAVFVWRRDSARRMPAEASTHIEIDPHRIE